MTVLLDQAIASIRDLPDDAQDALARMLLDLAGHDQAVIELTPEEASSFDESLTQADRGEFVSEDKVHAIWAKHGL